MNTVFNIGLHHFLFVSIILVGAGVATMLTKRNAIGILIGVELVLNAAGVNFVAFNRYAHPERQVVQEMPVGMAEQIEALRLEHGEADLNALALKVIERTNPDAVAVSLPPLSMRADDSAQRQVSSAGAIIAVPPMMVVRERAMDGVAFAIFIVVLAAAEAAVALAIFLNYYNNFSSIDVEKGTELQG